MSIAKEGCVSFILSVKVSFVLYDYFPFGGLQEDCVLTAQAMQALGHEVEVVTRTWKGTPPVELNVQLLGRRGGTNTARNVAFFQDLDAYFDTNPTDCVVAFNRVPNCDVYFSADPCYLVKVENKPFWYFWTGRHRHYRDTEAAIFRNPEKPQVYCLTQREIDTYHERYGTALERFHLLPPGVARVVRPLEEKTKVRADLRAEFGVPEDRVVALFVGSDYKRKGLMRNLEAIKVAAMEHPVELWVLGADQPGPYEAFAKQHDLSVRFFGGRSDVARFYDAADFMLHPAHSESAGKVLLEALTYGLPVVVSGVCGYARQVGDSGGGVVLSEPFSQDELNSVVTDLGRNDAERRNLSNAALEYARTEDIYSCAERFAQEIERHAAGGMPSG